MANTAGPGWGNYTGSRAQRPPETYNFNRNPTPYDTLNYVLMDLWRNDLTNDVFILISLAGNSTSKGQLADWYEITNTNAANFITQNGTAVPAGGTLTVNGAHGLNTSGLASTVTIAINNTISLGDLAVVAINTDALTLETGDETIQAGNLNMTNTNNTGTAGIIAFGGTGYANRFISNYGVAGAASANTFVGSLSGNALITSPGPGLGASNSGFGRISLNALTTGYNNTALGASSLASCSSGFQNCSAGFNSGRNLDTGSQNCFYGNSSGTAITSGTNNTFYGFSSGSNYAGAESSNIVVGSGILGTAGESNTLRIGNGTGAGATQINRAFVSGVYGITPAVVDPQLVISDSNGQFGTTLEPTVNRMTINNAPLIGSDATNKTYVDAIASGITFLTPAAAATTVNLSATYANGAAGVGATLTNNGAQAAFAVDGYSALLNDRILVKNQSAQADNGIYKVTTVGDGSTNWVLTRTTDYDLITQIKSGTVVPVLNGTTQSNTSWLEAQNITVIGTDAIIFVQFTLNTNNFLQVPNNLSDVANVVTARTNLGLTNVAIQNVTQYDVLVGGSANAITSVAPSATSGIPLISQGASANPIFGTAVVAGGGTGGVSFLPYSVICAGTTATGAFQNVSSVGSAGQVLTSNGSALPSWQAAPSTGITWSVITADQAAAVNNGYICNKAGLLTLTLPASAAVGTIIEVTGMNTALGWKIAQNAGQVIHFGTSTTSTGVAGSLASTAIYDAVKLVCNIANTSFIVLSAQGNITIV